ncbi:S-layer homology domain-containing protein [Paenibacillus silviterrae]|uniref:S-layer homology domain-containing protein n=1 Tax=Paenibacillus silviterrae TaxID=3242194 RepID=UPI002543AB1D|nr:S-layer homology domain-containing protein [Paenibacillus chinjuensis]
MRLKITGLLGLALAVLLGMVPQGALASGQQAIQAELTLHRSGGASGHPVRGETIEVAVHVPVSQGIFGAEYRITYDPAYLEPAAESEWSIHEGFEAWAKRVDRTAGTITMAMTRRTLPPEMQESLQLAAVPFRARSTGESQLRLMSFQAVDTKPKELRTEPEALLRLTVLPSQTPVEEPDDEDEDQGSGWGNGYSPLPAAGGSGVEPDMGRMPTAELVEYALKQLDALAPSSPKEQVDRVLRWLKEASHRLTRYDVTAAGAASQGESEVRLSSKEFGKHIDTYVKVLTAYERLSNSKGLPSLNHSEGREILVAPELSASSDRSLRIQVPETGLAKLQAAGISLRLRLGSVAFLIPPGAVKAQDSQREGLFVQFAAEPLPDNARQRQDGKPGEGYNPVGDRYELSAVRTGDGAASKLVGLFDRSLQVELPLPQEGLNGLDPRKLGVYRFDEKKSAWEYAGGLYRQGVMRFETEHFSEYSIMAYHKTFDDVGPGHWAAADISLLASKHIATGTDERNFTPSGDVTRAQFAALLARTLRLEATASTGRFDDVSPSSWYASSVEAVAQAGIVDGVGERRYAPEERITREQMAVMLVKASRLLQPEAAAVRSETLPFNDVNRISEWALAAVTEAYRLGFIQGITDRDYAPQQQVQRAQAASVMIRLLSAADRL